MGFLDKLKNGLKKTKNALFGQIDGLLRNFVKVDEEFLEELEDLLISSDVGAATAEQIIDELREKAKDDRLKNSDDVQVALKEILCSKLGEGDTLHLDSHPSVLLVIGVNGVGKTTTIGKIAAQMNNAGKKVLVAAADTFRAAAIEQLQVWCDRAGVEMIK